MKTVPAWVAGAVAAGAGAAGWVVVGHVAHRREAWDSEIYFSSLLPALATVTAVLGYLSPRGAWRWAALPFAAQALVMMVQNGDWSLLPLGLLLFACFAGLCLVPAWLGALVRRSIGGSSPS
jgi:hypothetical protein